MSNEELGSFVKKHPLKIVCAILAIIASAGIYITNTRIAETSALLEQKTTESARLATNVRNSAQLPEQFKALTSALEKIQGRLINAGQLATNLQYFYRLETDSGVELIDLRQTSSTALKGTTGVPFAVAVKGNFPTLIGYLQHLENGPHFSRVLTASMSGSAIDRESPLTLVLSIELLGQP